MAEEPKVLIVNFAGHNYSDARRWGQLATITDGYVRPDLPDRILFEITKAISGTTDEDWLIPSGLLLLNILAAVAYYHKHKKLRLLVWDKKRDREQKRDGADVPAYREVIIDEEQLNLLFEHFVKMSDEQVA